MEAAALNRERADAPEVSVVIPTHNRSELLPTTLQLVLGQRDVRPEILVVDDGSTDDTAALLAEVRDPRVRVFRHERSEGVAAARNHGLREARAEWVAFLDDDDIWAPHKLRTQLDALHESGALFCYGESLVLDVEQSVVMHDQPARDPGELPSRLLTGNVIPGGCSNVVTRTDAVRELGGFDEHLSMVADWDLWLRLANRGPAVVCRDELVAYRKHASNMSSRQGFQGKFKELLFFDGKELQEYGAAFDAVGYSRWLADAAPSPIQAARVHLSAATTFGSWRELVRAAGALVGGRAVGHAATRAREALHGALGDGHEPGVPVPEWLEPHRAG